MLNKVIALLVVFALFAPNQTALLAEAPQSETNQTSFFSNVYDSASKFYVEHKKKLAIAAMSLLFLYGAKKAYDHTGASSEEKNQNTDQGLDKLPKESHVVTSPGFKKQEEASKSKKHIPRHIRRQMRKKNKKNNKAEPTNVEVTNVVVEHKKDEVPSFSYPKRKKRQVPAEFKKPIKRKKRRKSKNRKPAQEETNPSTPTPPKTPAHKPTPAVPSSTPSTPSAADPSETPTTPGVAPTFALLPPPAETPSSPGPGKAETPSSPRKKRPKLKVEISRSRRTINTPASAPARVGGNGRSDERQPRLVRASSAPARHAAVGTMPHASPSPKGPAQPNSAPGRLPTQAKPKPRANVFFPRSPSSSSELSSSSSSASSSTSTVSSSSASSSLSSAAEAADPAVRKQQKRRKKLRRPRADRRANAERRTREVTDEIREALQLGPEASQREVYKTFLDRVRRSFARSRADRDKHSGVFMQDAETTVRRLGLSTLASLYHEENHPVDLNGNPMYREDLLSAIRSNTLRAPQTRNAEMQGALDVDRLPVPHDVATDLNQAWNDHYRLNRRANRRVLQKRRNKAAAKLREQGRIDAQLRKEQIEADNANARKEKSGFWERREAQREADREEARLRIEAEEARRQRYIAAMQDPRSDEQFLRDVSQAVREFLQQEEDSDASSLAGSVDEPNPLLPYLQPSPSDSDSVQLYDSGAPSLAGRGDESVSGSADEPSSPISPVRSLRHYLGLSSSDESDSGSADEPSSPSGSIKSLSYYLGLSSGDDQSDSADSDSDDNDEDLAAAQPRQKRVLLPPTRRIGRSGTLPRRKSERRGSRVNSLPPLKRSLSAPLPDNKENHRQLVLTDQGG